MSVRPNPNTGHFTLSFADPLMAESYYSVYDTMGKLLFQRPLPQGKDRAGGSNALRGGHLCAALYKQGG